MEKLFYGAALFLSLIMVFSLYRAVMGPTILDRLIGVNAIGSKTTVLLILIGLVFHRVDMFIDISLAYALLNFIATLGATKFFLRRLGVFMEDSEGDESL